MIGMKKNNKSVIPGFRLSLGVTMTMLSLIVLIPLCALVIYSAQLSPVEFLDTVTSP